MIGMKHIAAAVVLCLAVSIVWCDDVDCTNDTGADLCVSSLFESPGSHGHTGSDSGSDHHASHCTCICHAPSVEAGRETACAISPVGIVADHTPSYIVPAPGRTIFRPPLAA
jgi:hypothetical protein